MPDAEDGGATRPGRALGGEEMHRVHLEPVTGLGGEVPRERGLGHHPVFAPALAEEEAARLERPGDPGGAGDGVFHAPCENDRHGPIPMRVEAPRQDRTMLRLGPEAAGLRLDRALALAVPTLSRERLKALIAAGEVSLEGAVARDPARRLRGGESVEFSLPAPAPAGNVAQAIPLAVMFEDEHLLVLDKPAGLVVHPAAGNPDGTLVNALLHHCAGRLSGIGGVARPGIVHRIDKDTSGLLVVAKTDPAHRGLARQFAAHSVGRRYLAVVIGRPLPPAGRIETWLARSSANRHRMAASEAGRGKLAVTHYKVIENLTGAAAVECRLETGRTHQVRAHMAHLGHPLVGDLLYGGRRVMGYGIRRQALHARTLAFRHPVTQENLDFESPVSADIQELLSALRV
jgi:23S rRNA pseudouridine1911/1915/1917 synthase